MFTWPQSAGRRRLVADVLLMLLALWMGLAQFGSQGFGELESVAREPDGIGFVLVLLSSIPLLARRRDPFAVLLLTASASVGLVALKYGTTVHLGPAIALFTLASRSERGDLRPAIAVAAVSYVAIVLFELLSLDAGGGDPVVEGLLWTIAYVVGDRRREGHRRRAEIEQRTVAEERAHIARELHDSAGHAINLILVQAGAARVLHERDPERSRAALATVEQVARETLGEIDHLVGALRDGEDAGTAPLPGLEAVDTLVERHREAGLNLTARTLGERRALGPTLDRSAYRIAQEALTNAARHGEGSAALAIEFGERDLDLEVTNPVDPAAAPERGGGQGVVGMRERAALLGGTLTTERGNGAFRVHARLPYAPEAP